MPADGLQRAHAASSDFNASKDPAVEQCPIKAAQAIEIELIDADGRPVKDQAFEVETADKRRYAGKTAADGACRLDGIAEGACIVRFKLDRGACEFLESVALRAAAGGDATPGKSADGDPTQHIIAEGECIATVAARYGYQPDAIWKHDGNQRLRQSRKSGYVLDKGDVLTLPVKHPIDFAKATGKRHRFRAVAANTQFQLYLMTAAGEPRRGGAFLLELRRANGAELPSIEGETRADGFIDVPIPPDADKGTLRIREGEKARAVETQLGRLLPSSTVNGAQRRLHNLAYYRGADDGQLNADTKRALEEFQLDYGLKPTGELDDETADLLAKVHCS